MIGRAALSRKWRLLIAGAAAVAALAAVALLGRTVGTDVLRFIEWTRTLGGWAVVVYGAGYVVATVLLVPGSILTVGAGLLFGLVRGTVCVFAAATVGATAAFFLARTIAREPVRRRVEADPRFGAIDRAIGGEGFRLVLLLRLSPIFPFNLLNYALGLTAVRPRDYIAASIGMLPGTLLYVYAGSLVRNIAELAHGTTPRGAGYYALLVVGLLATAVVTIMLTRIARRALAQASNAPR